jgi:hypothetical protein
MTTNIPNRRVGDEQLYQHQLAEEKRLLEIEQNIKSLEVKIDTLTNNVSDLVSAWKAANWIVSFIKWAGGVSTAIVAIYTLIKMKG